MQTMAEDTRARVLRHDFIQGPTGGEHDVKNGLNISTLLVLPVLCLTPLALMAQGAAPTMSFFVTSVGPGDGANLGGLAGADRHCQSLAQAKGVGNRRRLLWISC